MNPETTSGKNRKLTRFLCQELLYDYATDQLDPRRRRDVEEYMAGCRETQREFEQLKRGLRGAQTVSKVRVATNLHEALVNFEPQWRKSLSAWTLWSSQRGWKVLPYAFIGMTLVLVLAVKKPWRPSPNKDVVLAEQTPVDLKSKEIKIPEAVPVAAVPAPAPAPAAPVPAPNSAAPTPASPAPPPKMPDMAAQTEAAGEKKPDGAPGPAKGFLMRGEIDVRDFGNSWPQVRDKIIALGGKAAGSVELGWLRKKDEAYFHLTMPEANYPELESFLGSFGPVRFSKERHPRVMPSGQIRIILTVKDSGGSGGGVTDEENPAETP